MSPCPLALVLEWMYFPFSIRNQVISSSPGSEVEDMHTVIICWPNINIGCYGNLKLPWAFNARM